MVSTLTLLLVDPYIPNPIPPVPMSTVMVSADAWLREKLPPPVKLVPAAIVITALLTVGKDAAVI